MSHIGGIVVPDKFRRAEHADYQNKTLSTESATHAAASPIRKSRPVRRSSWRLKPGQRS
jgi:hypothetical protein